MNTLTASTRHGTLLACDGSTYSLTLDSDERLLLDGQIASLVIESSAHAPLTLVTSTMMVCCTPGAFWRAFAGEKAEPSMKETGYWFAQTLLRQEQFVQWKTRFEGVMQQMTEILAPALPLITLPQPQLDAFTEECLARCDDHPTLTQVQVLATLLQQDIETIIRWLEERGRQVRRDEQGSRPQTEAAVSFALPKLPDTRSQEPTGDTGLSVIFLWTPVLVQQLQQTFYALPLDVRTNIRKASVAIAQNSGWPVEKVRYKLYTLRLDPHAPLSETSLEYTEPHLQNNGDEGTFPNVSSQNMDEAGGKEGGDADVYPSLHQQENDEQSLTEEPVQRFSVEISSATRAAPTRTCSARSTIGQFKWTDERVALLRAAFAALPPSAQYSRYAAAATIARQYNWPRQSVEYKLYALFPRPMDIAEPGVEVLKAGAFLWDVQITSESESLRHERWELDYPLGDFPYAMQSIIKYRGQRYEVQQAHSNLLVMHSIQPPSKTSKTDARKELALA